MSLHRFRRLRAAVFLLLFSALLLGAAAAGGFLAYGVVALRRPTQTVPFFGGPVEAPPAFPSPLDDTALLALSGIAFLFLAVGQVLHLRLRRVRRSLGGTRRRL